jgi:tetratricopeptide (TPR) repeat protein
VELAERHETPAERHAALRRSIDLYLHTGHEAALRLFPEREPLPLPDRGPGAATEPIADYAAAMAWFTAERQVLRSAAAAAVAAGLDEHTGWLAWTMRDFCYRRGHWRDWIEVQQAALTAATRRGDPGAQAESHLDLGRAHAQLRDDQPAHDHFDRAYRLFLAGDDSRQQAQALHGAAWLFSHQGRYDEAVARAEQALTLLEGIGDKRAQAYALNNLGWYRALLGDLPSALKDCRRALELQRELADRPGQAPTWDSLGYIHSRRGEYAEAADCYRQALDLRRELGDRYNEAATLAHLGDVHHAAGASDAADVAWREALDLFEELGHPDAAAVRTKLARPE